MTANARSNLGSLIATSLGAIVALGVDKLAGGGNGGAAWVLRVGTVVYLAAMLLGLRLPDRVDAVPQGTAAGGLGQTVPFAGAPFAEATAAAGPALSGNGLGGRQAEAAADTANAAGQRRRRRGIPAIGPVVGEAMRANAAIRVFYGFMIFFLAFILRSERFGKISDTVALAGLAVAIAAGGMIGTGIGSALKSRSPQAMMFTVLGLTAAAGTACAILFGLWSVWAVALAAAIAQTLVKVALDSILQREIPDEKRVVYVRLLRDAAPARARRGRHAWPASLAHRERLRRPDRRRRLPAGRAVLAAYRPAQAHPAGACGRCQPGPLEPERPGQLSRSAATARRTAAIFFASRLSGCLERR